MMCVCVRACVCVIKKNLCFSFSKAHDNETKSFHNYVVPLWCFCVVLKAGTGKKSCEKTNL